MTKRMLSLLLVLAMVISCLCGCMTNPVTETTQATQTTTEPTTEPTAAPTTEATEPPTEPTVEFTMPSTEFALEYRMTDEDITRCDEMITNCEALSYDADASRETVEAAWDELDDFLTYISDQVGIAQVLYYQTMDNETLSQTYLDAYDEYLLLADRANLLQKQMYDDSPVKDWFFEDWTEREILYLQNYQSEVIDLQSRLNELEVEFQALSDDTLYDGFVPLYVEYVAVANQIAALSGYDNYYDYSAELVYGRDYGTEELASFQSYMKTYLVPNFENMLNPLLAAQEAITDEELMNVAYFLQIDYDTQPGGVNYLQLYIDSFQGSTHDGFQQLFDSGCYIISDEENSYPGAFCTSFDYYDVSYCFFGPGYQTTNTLTHEMGHYYASNYENDDAAFDLLETHSQANEALMLAYLREHMTQAEYDFIKYYNLANNALMIMVCAMVDAFEQRVYALDTLEGFTSEDIDAIIDDVCEEFFGAYGGSEYVYNNLADMYNYIRQVTINSPCYYISYATSLVTTLNFSAQAESDSAAAREVYRKLVEEAWESTESYLGALEYAGAASPFQEESFQAILSLFQ